MSSSNCCFLTCTQISQEAGKVVWYLWFLPLEEFSTVCCGSHSQRLWYSQWSRSRCFSGSLLLFSVNQWMLAIWSLVPLPFLNVAWTSENYWFVYFWSLAWRILSITLLACETKRWVQLCGSLDSLWHCLSLVLEWKLTFSSPMATAEFSKSAGILSAALSQHHLLGLEIAQLEFHHLQLPTSNLFEQ